MQNHNKLLWRVDGADGIKTGHTKAAGRILVSSAVRVGRRLICVTINDGNDWADHATLLERGFSTYNVQQLITKGQAVGSISIFSGEISEVPLLAAEDFSVALRKDESVQMILSGPGFAYAPVTKGKTAGYAYVCVGDTVIGTVKLVYAQTVERTAGKKKVSFWERLFGGAK